MSEETKKGPTDLRTAVEDLINGSAQKVFDRVVEHLAEAEIKKRENWLEEGLAKLDKASLELRILENKQPDTISQARTFNADGSEKTPEVRGWSADALKKWKEEVKKAKELVDRLTNAVTKGINGDFESLKKIASKGGSEKSDVTPNTTEQ